MITNFKLFEKIDKSIINNISNDLYNKEHKLTGITETEYNNYIQNIQKLYPEKNLKKSCLFDNNKKSLPKDYKGNIRSWDSIVSDFDILNILNTIIQNFNKKLKLCDMGCGYGNIIYFAEKLGYDTLGIEVQTLYNNTYNKLGLNVINDDLLTMDYSFLKDFDVVYFYRPICDGKLMKHIIDKTYNKMKNGSLIILNFDLGVPLNDYTVIYSNYIRILSVIAKI